MFNIPLMDNYSSMAFSLITLVRLETSAPDKKG